MAANQIQNYVPDGWQEVRLDSIGSFSKGAGILKDQVLDTGHNAVRYGELYTKYDFQIKNIYSHISSQIISSTKKIKYGDILFAGSGETIDEIGKSAAYLLPEDCYAGGDIIIFTPKNADSLFLSYFLNVGEARKKLRELGQGQSVVHIYKRDLENVKLHLPPLPEQNRIVAVLEVWDKAIEKLARKIELKKSVKKGLMQELLTGTNRLPGFTGKWQIVKLGDISSISRGGSPRPIEAFITKDNTGLNWLRIGDISSESKYIYKTNEKIKKEGLAKTTLVENGDFILSNSMSFGRPYIMKISACIHDGWLALKDIVPSMNKEYLYYLLLSKKTQNLFMSLAAGSGVQNLKKETVSLTKVQIPNLEEQTAIANILTIADNEITELERKLSLLKDQKKYLLNNLISGDIRTPEDLKVSELEPSLC